MLTKHLSAPLARTHRRHSPEFKAQAIAACLHPGVSIAAVALANRLNANLLRKWVKAHRGQQPVSLPAKHLIDQRRESAHGPSPTLVPVTVQAADSALVEGIQIEIRRQQTVFHIAWPVSQASACAQWLRDVLR